MAAFDVYIEILINMRYRVPSAATPDEAETIAEGWAEKGVKGAVIDREIGPAYAEAVNTNSPDDDRECDPFEEEDEE